MTMTGRVDEHYFIEKLTINKKKMKSGRTLGGLGRNYAPRVTKKIGVIFS